MKHEAGGKALPPFLRTGGGICERKHRNQRMDDGTNENVQDLYEESKMRSYNESELKRSGRWTFVEGILYMSGIAGIEIEFIEERYSNG
jgi:hypothetical protein